MVRPQKDRLVSFRPDVSYFKPRGIPMMDLEQTRLTIDEHEALRLADLLDMSHEDAGRLMGVSRATFGRIIQRARKIIADALVNGKAVLIEGGNYRLVEEVRTFKCRKCRHEWEEPRGTGKPDQCPACDHTDLYRITKQTTKK